MKQLFFSLVLTIFMVSCQKESDNTSQKTPEQTIRNVSYGSDTAQRMDVYLPAGRTTLDTKVLVLIHGGAWSTGDKTEFNEYIPVFKQRLPGYAIFNVNYRLAKFPATNMFPAQENDIKAAFNAIVSKAEEYRFNREKLAVLGASAGAHLAMLQAYKNNTPKIKAAVDMFGPTDMISIYNKASSNLEQLALQALLGGTPTTNPAAYQSASPINFVSSQSPPTLILHGALDPLVPVAQSNALKAKLEQANVPVQLVVYPSEGHGWFGTNLTDSYGRITAFLTTYNP